MNKVLFASVIAGLLLLGTPRTEACNTHGYVRAQTLNDLFSTVPNGEVTATAQIGGDFNQQHEFTWSVAGNDLSFGEQNADALTGGQTAYDQLEGVIGDIELALNAQYDKDYVD